MTFTRKVSIEERVPTPELLMRNAPMRIYKRGAKWTTRRVLVWENTIYLYAHVVWNFLNPNDFIDTSSEVIHHIDDDCLNDMPNNLKKMTRKEHSALHRSKNPYVMKLSWSLDEVLKLRRLGVSWMEISRRLNVPNTTMHSYFSRYGLPRDGGAEPGTQGPWGVK